MLCRRIEGFYKSWLFPCFSSVPWLRIRSPWTDRSPPTPWCTCLRFHTISMNVLVSESHERREIRKKPECLGYDRSGLNRFGSESFNHGKRGRTRKWKT